MISVICIYKNFTLLKVYINVVYTFIGMNSQWICQ
jgi:hypothetical protein